MGAISENVNLTAEQKIEKLEMYCHKIENLFNEVKLWTNPVEINTKIENLYLTVNEMKPLVDQHQKRIDYIQGENLVQLVTDKEIKMLCLQSGVGQKQVAYDFNVAEQTASKYCNGDVGNLMLRHNIKQYFIQKIEENKLENKTKVVKKESVTKAKKG